MMNDLMCTLAVFAHDFNQPFEKFAHRINMGASASELAEAQQCVLSVHFMFDRDDFVYKLVREDYMELLNSISDEEMKKEEKLEYLGNKKRIVFSSEVPFSQLPQIEGWFRNTTAPQCVLIALLQHFNWLVTNWKLNGKDGEQAKNNWDTFAIDYNKFVAKGRNFDGYNVEMITEDEKSDLKDSLDRIEFIMDEEINYKLRAMQLNVQEQCWEDELWIGNARDSDEWLQFLERRFETGQEILLQHCNL